MLNRLRAWTTWGTVLGRLPPRPGALVSPQASRGAWGRALQGTAPSRMSWVQTLRGSWERSGSRGVLGARERYILCPEGI